MNRLNRLFWALLATFVVFALATTTAVALPGGAFFFGQARDVDLATGGKAIELSSTCSPGATCFDDLTFSGVAMPTRIDKFAELTVLSTDFNVTDDDCFGGSPRFAIRVDLDGDGVSNGSIFVYVGPSPSFSGCATNTWGNTGNLVGTTDAGRWDAMQLGGPLGNYAATATFIAGFPNHRILRFSLVVDSAWGFTDGEQTVLVNNITINDRVVDR